MHILHIGLPKTATSTLQTHFFPHSTNYHYIGVNQPRSRPNDPLYNHITKAIGSICENDRAYQIQKAAELLNKTTQNILFSEEMVLVDGHKSWTQKLEVLNLIFSKHPHKILLTLRRPWDCAFSLYVEMRADMQPSYPTFYEFWEKSNQAGIFRYRTLISTIQNIFGDSDIHIATFEKVISDPYEMFQDIGVLLADFPNIRELNVNAKTKSQSGIYTNPSRIKIRDLIIKKIDNSKSPFKKQTRKLVKNIIRGRLNFKIQSPSKLITYPDFEKVIEDCRTDLDWLKNNHGVSF